MSRRTRRKRRASDAPALARTAGPGPERGGSPDPDPDPDPDAGPPATFDSPGPAGFEATSATDFEYDSAAFDLAPASAVEAGSDGSRTALTGFDEPLPPPHAFLKGAVFGFVVLIPLTALTAYILAWLGVGDAQASYDTIIAFVAVFAGLPAIISAGGIGRAAASALVRSGGRGGPARAIRVAVFQTAIAEIGLVLLTVVPLGEVPTDLGRWASIATAGILAGSLGGFGLGLWVRYGSRQP